LERHVAWILTQDTGDVGGELLVSRCFMAYSQVSPLSQVPSTYLGDIAQPLILVNHSRLGFGAKDAHRAGIVAVCAVLTRAMI
jgi:hypothetical protein